MAAADFGSLVITLPWKSATTFAVAIVAACSHTPNPGGSAGPAANATQMARVTLEEVRRGPPQLDDGWPTGSPAAAGFDPVRLAAMTEAIRRSGDNVHALLIEKNGRLIYEQYFAGMDERHGQTIHTVFNRDTAHHVRSVTKSVVSALVGAAIQEGAIRSVEQPLIDFFPEHADLATPEWRKITIRDALMMSAGIEWDEVISYSDPRNYEIRMNNSDDPVRFVLERPVVEPAGTRWNYNDGLTYLLGAAVQRATGQPLVEYAQAKLFQPLGISRYRWLDWRPGVLHIAAGLILRPRDLAKFGSLYLNGGRWNGQQVLPEEWVSESTRPRRCLRLSRRGGEVGLVMGRVGLRIPVVAYPVPDNRWLDRSAHCRREWRAACVRCA